MKKAILTAFILSTFTILLVAGVQVEVAKANFLPNEKPTNPPPIIIQSPLNITYYQNDIMLNFTIVGISHWFEPAYHLTDVYYEYDGEPVYFSVDRSHNTEQFYTTLTGITKGTHNLIVYANGAGVYRDYHSSSTTAEYSLKDYSIQSTQTVTFIVDKDLESTPSPTEEPAPSTTQQPTSTPTSNPAVTVSLSESASALYYGNTINFTVSADGGVPPYTFAWHLDGQLAETSNSQYFSTDTQAVGSHHVYVQVTDADNSSATTLAVEFNVLPVSSTSPSSSLSPSNSPTQQPTPNLNIEPNNTQANFAPMIIIIGLVIGTVIVSLLAYFAKYKGWK